MPPSLIGGFHENSTDEEVVLVMVKSIGGSGAVGGLVVLIVRENVKESFK